MKTGYTPIYRINHDGVDITDRFNDRVTELQVVLTAGHGNPDTCTIIIDDRDWKVASPTVGRKLEIYLGYKEIGLAQQNVFEINTVEYLGPPRSIKITGTSVGYIGSLKAPAIKDFEGKSLKDIVGDIAQKGGVSAMVEQGLGETKVPFLNQTQSSLHLLQELERRYGAMAKFDNGKLVFIPRDSNESATGISMPSLLIRPDHLAVWSVRHSERGRYSGVRAAYMDEDTYQPKWIEHQNPKAPTDSQGDAEKTPYRFPKIFPNETEAQASMKSMMGALNRSMGEANITLSKGDPWVRDHMHMAITNMRDGINGGYVTETVTHTYVKGQGISTQILAKPPGYGEGVGADSADNDNQVFAPTEGSKLGERFEPTVIEAA